MPKGDGKGPSCGGAARELGNGQRKDFSGIDVHIQGRGPGGYCICPNCNVRVKHKAGVPCTSIKCSECNTAMIRE